jgi:hypothetical protein
VSFILTRIDLLPLKSLFSHDGNVSGDLFGTQDVDEGSLNLLDLPSIVYFIFLLFLRVVMQRMPRTKVAQVSIETFLDENGTDFQGFGNFTNPDLIA